MASSESDCSMCRIVSSVQMNSNVSSTGISAYEILWKDENLTAYRENIHPVSSKGHIIIIFNLHIPSVYALSSGDLPVLIDAQKVARHLLTSFTSFPVLPASTTENLSAVRIQGDVESKFRIGFLTFKDSKIPGRDHLHMHAYIAPADLIGWWRSIAYSPFSWYAISDLIAEIRESVSNNRVKSGYRNGRQAPIDMIPAAGVQEHSRGLLRK